MGDQGTVCTDRRYNRAFYTTVLCVCFAVLVIAFRTTPAATQKDGMSPVKCSISIM